MTSFSTASTVAALDDLAKSRPDCVQALANAVGALVYDIPGIRHRKVAEFDGIYYFSDKRPMQRMLRQVLKAKTEIEALFGCAPINLLLDFDCREVDLNSATRPFPGFGYVRFVSYQPHYLEIVHEIAHCAYFSKFALLDEGIAVYAETKICGAALSEQTLPFIPFLDLCNFRSGITFFDSLDSYRCFDFYHVAGRFIDLLVEKCGMTKLATFLEDSNFLTSGDELLEAALNLLDVSYSELLADLKIEDEALITVTDSHKMARSFLINGDVELAKRILADTSGRDETANTEELIVCASIVDVLSHPQRAAAFHLFSTIKRVLAYPSAKSNSTLDPALAVYGEILSAMVSSDWESLSNLTDRMAPGSNELGDPVLQMAIYTKLLFGRQDASQCSKAMTVLSSFISDHKETDEALQGLLERIERASVFLHPGAKQI